MALAIEDELEGDTMVVSILHPLVRTAAGYFLSTAGVAMGFATWPMRLVQNGKKVDVRDDGK